MAEFVAGRGTQALGIIGTVLGGLAVAAEGAVGTGLGRSTVTVDGADAVNKETLDMALQLTNSQRDNAILTAELNTEKKMVEVYNALNDKINRLNTEQAAINSAQSVTNCAVTSQLAVAQSNINTLMGLTKTVIPNTNVCPGWGTATVSVETTTSTTT